MSVPVEAEAELGQPGQPVLEAKHGAGCSGCLPPSRPGRTEAESSRATLSLGSETAAQPSPAGSASAVKRNGQPSVKAPGQRVRGGRGVSSALGRNTDLTSQEDRGRAKSPPASGHLGHSARVLRAVGGVRTFPVSGSRRMSVPWGGPHPRGGLASVLRFSLREHYYSSAHGLLYNSACLSSGVGDTPVATALAS